MILTVLGCLLALSACGLESSEEPENVGDEMTTTESTMCGLVDESLVRRIVGDRELEALGDGVENDAGQRQDPAECRIRDADAVQTILRVSASDVSGEQDYWRGQLREEAKGQEQCMTYSGDIGDGYGCTRNSGSFQGSANVYVVKGDRLIRVTILNWADASPEERLSLAEEIVKNVDENLTTFDAHDS